MLDYWSKSKKFLHCLGEKTKGSLKTPCLCLGLVAAFLFIFVSLGSGLFLESFAVKGDFYLADISRMFSPQEAADSFPGPLTTKKLSPESPQFILVENSTLLASTPPTTFSSQVLGSLVAGYESEDVKKVITEYIVETGDTLSSLAAKFDISLNTILWANSLTEKSTIKPGDKLVILPVSGMIHHVKDKDTLSGIAQTYKAKTEEIVTFNHLPESGAIYIGDILIIPGGTMPAPAVRKQQTSSSVPLANSYFIAPVTSPYRITQWLHWYNAIDFGGKCGDPIRAAAAGTVLKVALTSSTSRWAFNGAGNHITIMHPNGVVTMYGHISRSLVKPGDPVSQGQMIALMGGQPGTPGAGLSTGCHVHFGVTGASNPFSR